MIIVTGGAGFIGSALIWKLNTLGIEDILVVDHLGETDKWKNLAHLRFADYLDRSQFLECIEADRVPGQAEAIFHLGACSATTELNADYLMHNNYRYSVAVARWALSHNARMIYASSAATYGSGECGYSDSDATAQQLVPLNMYGYSKQLFDLWALKTGACRQIAGLKFFNVFGPNEYHKEDMSSVVFKAYGQILESGRLGLFKSYRPEYGHGEQRRDFIYVKDCVNVLAWLLEHRGVNGIFNLGTGQARSWNELATAVFSALGREPQIDYIEMPAGLRDRYQYFTQAEMSRLRDAGCDLEFHSLEEAVRDYVVGYLATAHPYLSTRWPNDDQDQGRVSSEADPAHRHHAA